MDPRQFQIEYGSEPRGTYNPADDGWTSYHTFPDVVSEMAKLWYGRLIADPVRSMSNVGAGIIGNVPQIQVDDSTDLRKIGGQYVAPGGSGGIGDIVNALMLYSGPGMLTGKPGLATAGMFAGEQAVGANLAMKKIAERALERGVDPDKVRKITGWFKGMEGKQRFEIDDRVMKLKPLDEFSWTDKFGRYSKEGTTLDQVIDHPTIFEHYPELRDVKVEFGPHLVGEGQRAEFEEGKNVIRIFGIGGHGVEDTILHEVQHWVQKKENFARGSNQHEEYRYLQSKGGLSSDLVPPDTTLRDAAFKRYLDHAGEIEARDAAARRTWDADMRREVPPTLREDAIIRWGDKDAEEVYRELMR